MNLIIDIGNTSIKTAVFDRHHKMIYFNRSMPVTYLDDLKHLTKNYRLRHALISMVGPQVKDLESCLKDEKISFLYLNNRLKLPFKIAYNTPETIGADRLALTAGAVLLTPNKHQLIIDAGTCVTYDFIDAENVYHGGAISPGLQLRYKALNDYTANLPLLKPQDKIVDLIGKDTKTSIQSGVVRGLANEIEGFIVKYNLKFKPLTVYLTGGDEKVLDRYIKNKIFVSSKFLLMEGMNYILNLNK